MLFIIIPLIVFIGFWLYLGIAEDMWGSGFAIAFYVATLAFLITMFFGVVVVETADCDWVEISTTEVAAFSDSVGIKGRTYLGRGYVEDTLSYFYVLDTPCGMTVKQVTAEQCYIKYTDKAPYVVAYEARTKNGFIRWAFGNSGKKSYTFYLPEGSVITDYYNIDLE